MPSTHKKDKPWDTDDIDKWKIEAFTAADNAGGVFTEESKFVTLFPRYLEVYLREAWPHVTKALDKHGIACTLDLIEGSMEVRTTRKTFDPSAILKARDLTKLLARSVPAPQAVKVLEDGTACDVVPIRNLVGRKERFVKRRQRLLGPGGATLKALQLLTGCYVLVHGNTVAAMGPYKGLKDVRRFVEACMENTHPVYLIRDLMTRRQLAADPAMASESWDRYLPNLKAKALSRRRVPHRVVDKAKKVYTPFPPPPEKSKVDLQIESGEYFLSKQAKERVAEEQRAEKAKAKKEERTREREKEFVAPEEPAAEGKAEKHKKRKRAKGAGKE